MNESLYSKEKKLETALDKLKSLTENPISFSSGINDLYEEKNQLEIEKRDMEHKYNKLLSEHKSLKVKLNELESETLKNKKLQDDFNQDIKELSQETDSLVEEIEKWQT
tara:strand:+ start:105 stop:431 length:327 start_codon:yes stop_codon:yes gene_type:complete